MNETQVPTVRTWQSKCYYIKDPVTGWWTYFTITPEIGLLQIFGDWGTFTDNFADRWSAPGPDFRKFLITASQDYLASAMATTAAQYDRRTSRRDVERRLNHILTTLWPLFIEALKAELAA